MAGKSKLFQYIFLLLLHIPIISFCQTDSIRGPVKMVRENFISMDSAGKKSNYGHSPTDYMFDFGERELEEFTNQKWYHTLSGLYVNFTKEFGENGNPLKQTWFNRNGSIFLIYTYRYDDRRNLIYTNRTTGEPFFTIRRFSYNELNQLTSSTYSSNNPDRNNYECHVYDSRGNLIETTHFGEGNKIYAFRYKYADNGRLMSKTSVHFPDMRKAGANIPQPITTGKEYAWEEYNYDQAGNMVSKKSYSGESRAGSKQPDQFTILEYSGRQLVAENESLSASPEKIFKRYSYTEKGLLASRVLSLGKKTAFPLASDHYTYDSSGNILKVVFKRKEVISTINFDYKFDQYNNWVEQRKSVNGKLMFIRQRAITYF